MSHTPPFPNLPEELSKKLASISLLVLDMDGVLTDGSLLINEKGEHTRSFYALDGLGLRIWHDAGFQSALITASPHDNLVKTRASEMNIEHIIQPCHNKQKALEELAEKLNLPLSQVAFMGDDLIDRAAMSIAGLSISVPNGHPVVQSEADYVTHSFGGKGAVREAVDLLLLGRGVFEKMYHQFEAK